jgi:ABC-type multidrug transport system permease subunit
VFYQQPHTQIGAQNRVALCFFGTLFCAMNAVSAIPVIIEDRAAYYREHASGTYRSFTYLISIVLAEFPITFIAAVLWATPVYWLAGLTPEFGTYLFWFLTLLLTTMTFNSWCQCCACAAPSLEVATAGSTGLITLFTIFAGFMIPKDSIPDYWIWVYHISIPRYSVEALTVNELEDTTYYCTSSEEVTIPGCNPPQTACQYTNGNQVIDAFDMNADMKNWDLLILLIYTFFLIFLSHLALRYLRVIKR